MSQATKAAYDYATHKTKFRKDVLKEVDADNYVSRHSDSMEDFQCGVEWERQQAIEAYRNLCPSFYKSHTRHECENYFHYIEWKTKVCDMNCEYMKNFMEKI